MSKPQTSVQTFAFLNKGLNKRKCKFSPKNHALTVNRFLEQRKDPWF